MTNVRQPQSRSVATAVAILAALWLVSLWTLVAAPLAAQRGLSPEERRIRQAVDAHFDGAVTLLEETINIPSGTLNLAGVREVGRVFRRELDAIGFTTRWEELPPEVNRAGHLIAEWQGPRFRPGGKRLLLIGHLDTVFENESERFVRTDSVASGAGAVDMKGGNVAAILALKALKQSGALDATSIILIFTGDEESAGRPLEVSRKSLMDAARRSDLALAFEGGDAHNATIARRGASMWVLTTTGNQGHSSAIFRETLGFGAIYESARILNAFREQLWNQPYLTFSPGVILGGTEVEYDTAAVSGTSSGKVNIVPRRVVAHGDLRTLTRGQEDSVRAVMRAIVANNLPGTTATIEFVDGYPGMPPTPGGREALRIFDQASQDLGYPAVAALPPERRGAGDIGFVADIIPGLDGLGVDGFGAHAPSEGIYLPSLRMAALRAAVLINRLSRPAQPATD